MRHLTHGEYIPPFANGIILKESSINLELCSPSINFVRPNIEPLFKGNDHLMDKYNNYLNEFKYHYPNDNILSKTYEVTLIRDLIMYFLYQEKKVNRIKTMNLSVIAKLFKYKTHNGVSYAIEKVQSYINNPRTLTITNKTIFFYLFYKFNQILNDNSINKRLNG